MKALEFRNKTKEELTEDLKTMRSDLEKYVRDVLMDKEKDKHKPKKLKKDIARLKTVLAEKEVLENNA